MVWDKVTSGAKKAYGKAKEFDQQMVEAHSDGDTGDELMGGGEPDRSFDLGIGPADDSDDGGGMGFDMGEDRDRQIPDALGGDSDGDDDLPFF